MKEEATLIMAILLVILNIFSKNFYKNIFPVMLRKQAFSAITKARG